MFRTVAMLSLAAALAAAAADVSVSLRDHPIASAGTTTFVDSPSHMWTASTQHPPGAGYHADQPQRAPPPGLNLTVAATVPGDLLTDLQRAGVIADPWYVPQPSPNHPPTHPPTIPQPSPNHPQTVSSCRCDGHARAPDGCHLLRGSCWHGNLDVLLHHLSRVSHTSSVRPRRSAVHLTYFEL